MFRPLEHNAKTTYILTVKECKYIVTMLRLHNTPNGCPRYNALVTPFEDLNETGESLTYNYNFRGSYCSERQEAQQIAELIHEKRKGE